MKNKKSWLVLFFLSLLSSIQFISAVGEFDRFKQSLLDIFGFVLGGISNSSDTEIIVIKSMVFLLLVAVIHFTLKKSNMFEGKVNAVVTVIVSLIAIRFITTESLVKFIWLPYGGLGVLLASIFPFIIFFFFIENMDARPIRLIGWVAFIFIYAMLAYLRWGDFVVDIAKGGVYWWENLAMIYLIIAVVSLIVLLFEGSIRRSLLVSSIRKGLNVHGIQLKNDLVNELKKVQDNLASPYLHKSEADKLKEEMGRINRALRRFS